MDQNQVVDSELQKAIDDITKTTSVDPVFSDPVAAPSSIPEGEENAPIEAVGPFPEPEPILAPVAEPIVPEAPVVTEAPTLPDLSAPVIEEAPAPVVEPAVENTVSTPAIGGMKNVKDAALRDLMPLLGKMNINASQKFRIYRNAFEELRDYAVLEDAYKAASEITNEVERGEALLYLVEEIDKID